MALKIKAKEKKLKFSKDGPEVYRYVMVPDLYSTLDSEKVIKEAAIRSGVSEGVMQACWKGAGEVIKAWATEGHSVALPGLGNMRFGLSAKAVEDVNDVKSSLIRTRRIVFTPTVALKEELANTAINSVMNLKLDILENEEGPGLGGAILAAVGCGEYASVEEACDKLVKVKTTVEPDPELIRKYEERYQEFKKLYPTVKSLF